MILRRLEVRNFRKLIEPVRVDDLGDGLTIIAGDNEDGKSTLLQALRSLLFDRHRLSGRALEAMLPYNRPVAPELVLAFDHDGRRYELKKVFGRGASAVLSADGVAWRGLEAEERLQGMLGFEPPGSGAAAADRHHGVWGLLWVEQGSAFRNLAVSDGNQQVLRQTLEHEVDAVLAGDQGHALLEAVRGDYRRWFTETGRPKKILKTAAEAMAARAETVARMRTRLETYHERLDELDRLRARLAAMAAADTVPAARRIVADAEHDRVEANALAAAGQAANTALELKQSQARSVGSRWQQRQDAVRAWDEARRQCERVRARLAEQADALMSATERAETALANAEAAHVGLVRADAVSRLVHRREDRRRHEERRDDLEQRRRLAVVALDAAERARRRAAEQAMTTDRVAALRRLDQAARDSAVALEAAATRLTFAHDAGLPLRLDGKAVAPGTSVSVFDTASIDLGPYGSLTVLPGGGDLAERRAACATARQALVQALADAGVADPDAAQRRLDENRTWLRKADTEAEVAKAHAPAGLEALERDLLAVHDTLATLDSADAGFSDEEWDLQAEATTLSVEQAAAVRRGAEATVQRARRDLETAQTALRDLQAKRAHLQGQLAEADASEARLADRLAADRAELDDQSLQQAVMVANIDLQEARASVSAARAAVNARPLDAAEARLTQARANLLALEAEAAEATRRLESIRIELRVLGEEGLAEALADAEADWERARMQAERLERDGRAVRLLYETLEAAQQAAKQHYLEPIRQRTRRYLDRLLPDSDMLFDRKTLAISHLRRDGIDEPFDHLSIGTREQIAVITRLAFADLLTANGRPAAVILDDALVYADSGRFRAMKRVLQEAAQRFQVIVLTCREGDYRDLDAPIRRVTA